MSQEGEARKAATSSEGNKRRIQWAIYLSVFAALIAVFVGVMFGLHTLRFPEWAVYTIAVAVIAVAVWFLEESPLNPQAHLDRDPLGRNFLVANRHMVRAWGLRRRDVEWRESRAPDLPTYAVDTFSKLEVDPEVSVEADGLLWVAGTRDWHGWPDPPRFVVVGFDAQGNVRAADDLYSWPKRWRIPLSPIQGRYAG